MVALSVATAAVRAASAAARPRLTTITRRRRSNRSTYAPLTRASSIQGSWCTNAAPATRPGSPVSCATSSGPAIMVTPSPMFETALAVQTLAKSGPSEERAGKGPPRTPTGDPAPGRRPEPGASRPYADWGASEVRDWCSVALSIPADAARTTLGRLRDQHLLTRGRDQRQVEAGDLHAASGDVVKDERS